MEGVVEGQHKIKNIIQTYFKDEVYDYGRNNRFILVLTILGICLGVYFFMEKSYSIYKIKSKQPEARFDLIFYLMYYLKPIVLICSSIFIWFISYQLVPPFGF